MRNGMKKTTMNQIGKKDSALLGIRTSLDGDWLKR
jgi:hypothetical protein